MSTAVDTRTLLPWPAEWFPHRPRAWVVLTTGLLAVASMGILWCGVAALFAEPEIGVILFIAAVCHSTLTAMDLCMLRRWRRVRRRPLALLVTGSAHDGVAIRYSSRFRGLLRTFLLNSFTVVAVCTAGGIIGEMVPPHTRSADATPLTGMVGSVLLLTWVGWLAWVLVEIVGMRVARGRLIIGPKGIYHRSHTFEHFVPWDAVIALDAVPSRSGPLIMATTVPSDATRTCRTAWIGKQDEFKLLPYLVVRGRFLSADPAMAYHALQYYHAHPEARAELLSSAGVQRIRSGNLLDR